MPNSQETEKKKKRAERKSCGKGEKVHFHQGRKIKRKQKVPSKENLSPS